MKKDHRGLSLIEIIVVIAIMSILAGTVGIGVGMALRRPVDECASKLQASLQSNRLTAMGKISAKLEIYMDDGYIYIRETIVSSDGVRTTETRIGDRGILLEYKLSGGDALIPLPEDGSPLILSFDRSSGAFKDLEEMTLPNVYCEKIVISKGDRVKELTLARLTGKVTLQ